MRIYICAWRCRVLGFCSLCSSPLAPRSHNEPPVSFCVLLCNPISAPAQADWDALLSKEEVVFARTSPQQKLEICENYQVSVSVCGSLLVRAVFDRGDALCSKYHRTYGSTCSY